MNTHKLHRLARTNKVDALNTAICAGAGINEKDQFGSTALHYSIAHENFEIARRLLEHGAEVIVQNAQGATALHHAVEYGAIEIAELLLKQNRDVISISNKHGNQPLWTACFNARGNYDIVKLLLSYGANAMHQNKVGKSPLDLASTIGDDLLAEILENSLVSE